PRLVRETLRHLLERLLPALTITLDVEHESQPGVRILAQRDPTHQMLEGIQRLAPPADHDAGLRAPHLQLDGRVALAVADHLDTRRIDEMPDDDLEDLFCSRRNGLTGSRFPGNSGTVSGLSARGLRLLERRAYRRANAGPTRAEAEQSTCSILEYLDFDL